MERSTSAIVLEGELEEEEEEKEELEDTEDFRTEAGESLTTTLRCTSVTNSSISSSSEGEERSKENLLRCLP